MAFFVRTKNKITHESNHMNSSVFLLLLLRSLMVFVATSERPLWHVNARLICQCMGSTQSFTLLPRRSISFDIQNNVLDASKQCLSTIHFWWIVRVCESIPPSALQGHNTKIHFGVFFSFQPFTVALCAFGNVADRKKRWIKADGKCVSKGVRVPLRGCCCCRYLMFSIF